MKQWLAQAASEIRFITYVCTTRQAFPSFRLRQPLAPAATSSVPLMPLLCLTLRLLVSLSSQRTSTAKSANTTTAIRYRSIWLNQVVVPSTERCLAESSFRSGACQSRREKPIDTDIRNWHCLSGPNQVYLGQVRSSHLLQRLQRDTLRRWLSRESWTWSY